MLIIIYEYSINYNTLKLSNFIVIYKIECLIVIIPLIKKRFPEKNQG